MKPIAPMLCHHNIGRAFAVTFPAFCWGTRIKGPQRVLLFLFSTQLLWEPQLLCRPQHSNSAAMLTLQELPCMTMQEILLNLIYSGTATRSGSCFRADGSRGGFGAAAGAGGYGAPQYPAAAAGGFGYGGFPAQAAGPAGAYGYGYGGYAQPYAAPQAAYGGYGGYGAADPYAAAAAGGYGGYGGAASGGASSGGGGGGGTWQELHDGEGRPYYYNTTSGVSQWEKPADMA